MDIRDLIITMLAVAVVWQLLQEDKPFSNAETWDWVDYRGNKRTIGVHREVHG